MLFRENFSAKYGYLLHSHNPRRWQNRPLKLQTFRVTVHRRQHGNCQNNIYDFPTFFSHHEPPTIKKADVARHPKVFDHVGLLFNKPPGIHRVALHPVIRRLYINSARSQPKLRSTQLPLIPH